MSFNIALTGLNATSEQLNTISNNIANANTTGFKSSRTEFGSVYADTQAMGVEVLGTTQSITLGGALLNTNRTLDLAISGGGFFIVKDLSGETQYTRAGAFGTDASGNIINSAGQKLQGYPTNANGDLLTGTISDLRINISTLPAKATDSLEFVANLDANAVPPTAAFDPAKLNSYNSTYTLKAYDSQGREHTLTQYFVKKADNAWMSHYYVDGLQAGSQLMTFDSRGVMTSPANDAMAISADPAAYLADAQAAAAAAVPDLTAAQAAKVTADADLTTAQAAAAPLIADETAQINTLAGLRAAADAAEAAYQAAVNAVPHDPVDEAAKLADRDAADAAVAAQIPITNAAIAAAVTPKAAVAAAEIAANNAAQAVVQAQTRVDVTAAVVQAASGTVTPRIAVALPGGVAPLDIAVNYSGTTQYGTNFDVTTSLASGYASGEQTGIGIDSNGKVFVNYSNGQSQLQGQVILASFSNPEGLRPVSGTAWVVTDESGAALGGEAGVGQRGSIYAAALENSNVDMTEELVNLMQGQRNYQANTKVISTQKDLDQILFSSM